MIDRIRDWLDETACPLLDIEREERVGLLARKVAKSMRQEGRFFSFRETATFLHMAVDDLPLVKERIYELTLKHVLDNYIIKERDRVGLRWIAKALKLSDEKTREIELRVGRHVFQEYLSFAISGGYLDDEELDQLHTLARSLGTTTKELLMDYLSGSGEQFLERILAGMAEDGKITDESWQRLISSTQALGLAERGFLTVLQKPGERLAERILTNTQPDDEASYAQYRSVLNLLDHLNVPDSLEA